MVVFIEELVGENVLLCVDTNYLSRFEQIQSG